MPRLSLSLPLYGLLIYRKLMKLHRTFDMVRKKKFSSEYTHTYVCRDRQHQWNDGALGTYRRFDRSNVRE